MHGPKDVPDAIDPASVKTMFTFWEYKRTAGREAAGLRLDHLTAEARVFVARA